MKAGVEPYPEPVVDGIRRTLCFVLGQRSVGWSGWNFLKYYLHLTVKQVFDSSHRVSNEINPRVGVAGY